MEAVVLGEPILFLPPSHPVLGQPFPLGFLPCPWSCWSDFSEPDNLVGPQFKANGLLSSTRVCPPALSGPTAFSTAGCGGNGGKSHCGLQMVFVIHLVLKFYCGALRYAGLLIKPVLSYW